MAETRIWFQYRSNSFSIQIDTTKSYVDDLRDRVFAKVTASVSYFSALDLELVRVMGSEGGTTVTGIEFNELDKLRMNRAFDTVDFEFGRKDVRVTEMVKAGFRFQNMSPRLSIEGYGPYPNGVCHILVLAPQHVGPQEYISVRSNLSRLGITATQLDIDYLMKNEPSWYLQLKSPSLELCEAQHIITLAKTRIKSTAINTIAFANSVYLNGQLHISADRSNSIYLALSKTWGILVAKVFVNARAAFDREVEMNQAIGEHNNVIQFVQSFDAGENRWVILMPHFPCSVEDAKMRWPVTSGRSVMPLAMLARDCFSALIHIHSKGFCFGDLKPSNIMLSSGNEGKACLVDFGAVVKLGSPMVEYTKAYCLDVHTDVGSEMLDWVCFASTLAECLGIDLAICATRRDLLYQMEARELNGRLYILLKECLVEQPQLSLIQTALAAFVEALE